MGGFYKRLVGLVKRALRKSLGRRLLTLIQIQTLVKEIEATVNSRPLVYVENDLDSNITISPSHFLTINPKTGVPENIIDINDENYEQRESSSERLLKLWKKRQKTLDDFWKIWRDEYLVFVKEAKQQSKLGELCRNLRQKLEMLFKLRTLYLGAAGKLVELFN
ncbi:uncharacterized protein LOC132743899 [Ruditapes philippinarum]|uniref:uncharacterized protein LOC132743899 n=1 Tax=Ruditapes philippinarum TaxID=129788 RepID=UPI00295AB83A|nr:uncharacterized protein LOC132743899 [Ruditapes philippinarum]